MNFECYVKLKSLSNPATSLKRAVFEAHEDGVEYLQVLDLLDYEDELSIGDDYVIQVYDKSQQNEVSAKADYILANVCVAVDVAVQRQQKQTLAKQKKQSIERQQNIVTIQTPFCRFEFPSDGDYDQLPGQHLFIYVSKTKQ